MARWAYLRDLGDHWVRTVSWGQKFQASGPRKAWWGSPWQEKTWWWLKESRLDQRKEKGIYIDWHISIEEWCQAPVMWSFLDSPRHKFNSSRPPSGFLVLRRLIPTANQYFCCCEAWQLTLRLPSTNPRATHTYRAEETQCLWAFHNWASSFKCCNVHEVHIIDKKYPW